MTVLEMLALAGFVTAVIAKMGLWYKKTWGWLVGTISAVFWLIWSVMVAVSQPQLGGWILFANDAVFIALSLIGWRVWRREENKPL